jgi:hypothetical protein
MTETAPADLDEALRLRARSAREGSVPAMRAIMQYHLHEQRASSPPAPSRDESLDELDELARKRASDSDRALGFVEAFGPDAA